MGLSCSCPDWDGDPGTWAYYPPNDFTALRASRRKRCISCKSLIDIGGDCLKFSRIRAPSTDIEERIMGEEIPMSPHYMCEKCGEIYLNLTDIGYCLDAYSDMNEAMAEYHEITGFEPMAANG